MLLEFTDSLFLTIGFLASGAIALVLSSLWRFLRSPGPWGIPLLGYYPFLRSDFYVHLHELSKIHGEVYLINLAGQYFVYLGSIRAIRAAHVKQAAFFPGRSHKHSFVEAAMENGLSFLDGKEWKIHRKFAVQGMSEIGLNPNKEEFKANAKQAIRSTLETLAKGESQIINFTRLLLGKCPSVLLKILLGDSITEDEGNQLNEGYLKILAPMTHKSVLLAGSTARHLIFPQVPGYFDLLVGTKDMTNLLFKIVADHKRSFDPNANPKDFIDAYLKERKFLEENVDPLATCFTDLALVSSLILMYGEGAVGISLFLASNLQTISEHPDVQDAIHEEIVQVVGVERLPVWEDRISLPLTMSAVKELVRTSVFIPAYADLECIRDTTILGVKVPKGCITIVNSWAVQNDPVLYKNPERFDATRFLPDKPRVEHPIMFGVGKRTCTGESIVMSEVFLFVASILQNFLLLPAVDDVRGRNTDALNQDETTHVKLRAILRPGSHYK